MDRKQQVLLKLKPKVKAFGFNKKELMSVAAKIADNLTSTDDASDEDVNAEIDTAIDAVLPYLQVSQSFANRVIEENRKKNDDDGTDGDDDPCLLYTSKHLYIKCHLVMLLKFSNKVVLSVEVDGTGKD